MLFKTALFSPLESKGTLEYHLVQSPCSTNEKLKLREGKALAQVTQKVRTDSWPNSQVILSASPSGTQEPSYAPPCLGDPIAAWIFVLPDLWVTCPAKTCTKQAYYCFPAQTPLLWNCLQPQSKLNREKNLMKLPSCWVTPPPWPHLIGWYPMRGGEQSSLSKARLNLALG